MKRSCIA